jgi:hypothetical protein
MEEGEKEEKEEEKRPLDKDRGSHYELYSIRK